MVLGGYFRDVCAVIVHMMIVNSPCMVPDSVVTPDTHSQEDWGFSGMVRDAWGIWRVFIIPSRKDETVYTEAFSSFANEQNTTADHVSTETQSFDNFSPS